MGTIIIDEKNINLELEKIESLKENLDILCKKEENLKQDLQKIFEVLN